MAPQTKIDRSFGALTPALSEWILEAVDAMGFVKTTPVQHAAIPMFMKNSDVVVEAVTGSGKTLAYVLVIVYSHYADPVKVSHPHRSTVTPTRCAHQEASRGRHHHLANKRAGNADPYCAVFFTEISRSISCSIRNGGRRQRYGRCRCAAKTNVPCWYT